MAGFTYNGLTTAIQNYMDNTETTFTNTIPTFIQQAEEKILKSADLPVFRENVTGTASSGNTYLSTPTDFLSPRSLAVIDSSNNYSYLLLKHVSWIRDYTPAESYINFTVTVASGENTYGSGNKYYINGENSPTLNLIEGQIYRFDQSDSTNLNHPLRFSTTGNGTWAGGTEYTTGVTTVGTPGSVGAYTQIVVAREAPTLHYYCTNHSGMGGDANTLEGAETDLPLFYAIFDDNTFILAPTPQADLTFELHYFYRPSSLVDAGGTGSTWLSTNASNTLLYGSLVEAAIFMKLTPAEIQTYDVKYQEGLARLKLLGESKDVRDEARYDSLRVPPQ